MTTIYVGNAPCSWGTLEFEGTQANRVDFERMLNELAASGYTGSELGDWGFMPTDSDRLVEEFRRRNLDLTGAYLGVRLRDRDAHKSGAQMAVQIAGLLATTADRLGQTVRPFLVLADDAGSVPIRVQNAGRVQPEMMLSEEEWRLYAQGAEAIARAVRQETGLRTVFHHHCAGYVETEEEIAILMDRTDPEVLGLVFDTGHFAFGAGSCDSVLDGLRRFAARIEYIHFKDYDPQVGVMSRQQGWDYFEAIRHAAFCELGQGCVDFPAVLAWLREQGYSGYATVEQDILPGMGTPKESAERNRSYLRSIGL
jgi:inosose dehydratase